VGEKLEKRREIGRKKHPNQREEKERKHPQIAAKGGQSVINPTSVVILRQSQRGGRKGCGPKLR